MIDFRNVPKVAYEDMNRVHAEEVELLNTIEKLLDENGSIEQINTVTEELFLHTREHFAKEEKLMQEVGFPAYQMHKNEHNRVLSEFQYVLMDYRNKKDNAILKEYFTELVPVWLHQHIASMDTVTAQFITMVKRGA